MIKDKPYIKMYDLVDQKLVSKFDTGISDNINGELEFWMDRVPQTEKIKEVVILFGKNLDYIAGIGLTLQDAIKDAMSIMESDNYDDFILQLNIEYFPYRVKIGYSLNLTEYMSDKQYNDFCIEQNTGISV